MALQWLWLGAAESWVLKGRASGPPGQWRGGFVIHVGGQADSRRPTCPPSRPGARWSDERPRECPPLRLRAPPTGQAGSAAQRCCLRLDGAEWGPS